MYSNAKFDDPNEHLVGEDETRVQEFYARSPYPDLGVGLKDPSHWLDAFKAVAPMPNRGRYLDAGCGTGHIVCGFAKRYADWNNVGIDLSEPSLQVADKLKKKHSITNVTLHCKSYLDDLSDLGLFDYIGCHGTIHHSEDPVSALNNLARCLKTTGLMYVHLYGLRIDRRKFEIKRLLDIFVPDLNDIEGRWEIYKALIDHQKGRKLNRIARLRLIDIYALIRNGLRNRIRVSKGVVWSPGWDAEYDQPNAPWIDHFCHPCERAYEVRDVIELFKNCELEIVHMARQGREYPKLIPAKWRQQYSGMPKELKWEISELLADGGGSFGVVARKAK